MAEYNGTRQSSVPSTVSDNAFFYTDFFQILQRFSLLKEIKRINAQQLCQNTVISKEVQRIRKKKNTKRTTNNRLGLGCTGLGTLISPFKKMFFKQALHSFI